MIGKISPIKKKHDTAGGAIKSIGASLADYGMNMFPGTSKTIVPYKEKNGEYRTGLNPDALYIKRMSPDEAKQERERVQALLDELTDATNLDLSPRSPYYKDMFERDGQEHAEVVKLYDQDNVFNLTIPQKAITFAWLRVHPEIAPSYVAWEKGLSSSRCPDIAQCQFFVNDTDYEAKVEFEQNTLMDKASNIWFNMSPDRRYKIAKLLNIPVGPNSGFEVVYNEGKRYINQTAESVQTASNVTNFIKVAEMADENIDIRFRISEAFDFNVYRKGKGGIVYEVYTNDRVADSEQELIEMFSSPKNQEQYLALIKKIETAKSVAV